MRTSTAFGLAGALLGAGVMTTLIVRKVQAKPVQSSGSTTTPGGWPVEPGIVPPPPDAIWLKVTGVPAGAFDSSQFWTDWFNAHSLRAADMPLDARAKILAAGAALGTDAQGFIRWRPTSTGQLTALAIADQLERQTGTAAQVLSAGVKEYVNQAAALPENPVTKAMGI